MSKKRNLQNKPQPLRPQSRVAPPQPEVSIQQSIQQYSGDILPPQLLNEYNVVSPGFAERVLARFERQTDHRQDMERVAMNSDVAHRERGSAERTRGQYLAFGIGSIGLSLCTYAAISGAEWFGATVALSVIGTGVYAFLARHKSPPASPSQEKQG